MIFQSLIVINVKVTDNAIKKVRKYQIKKKFDKQIEYLKIDPQHHSLKFQPVISAKGIYKIQNRFALLGIGGKTCAKYNERV